MSDELVGRNSSSITQISWPSLGVSRDDRVGGVREKIIKEEMGGKRKKENNSTGINTRVRGVCWLAGTARNHRGLHSLAKKSGAHTRSWMVHGPRFRRSRVGPGLPTVVEKRRPATAWALRGALVFRAVPLPSVRTHLPILWTEDHNSVNAVTTPVR